MAITLIQQASGATDTVNLTVTLGSGTTTGRVLVLIQGQDGASWGSPNVSGGSATAVLVSTETATGTDGIVFTHIYELYNVANGTTAFSIHEGNDAPAYGMSAVVTEWGGLGWSGASCFGTNAVATATSAAPSAGAITPSVANELFLSNFAVDYSLGSTTTSGPTNSFTSLTTASAPTQTDVGAAYLIAADSLAKSTAWGLSASPVWTSTVASFKPASAPAAPTIGSAAYVGPTSASVSWTAPANNGGSAITGYSIQVNDLTTSTTTYVTVGNVTSDTLTGLTTAHTYNFAVAAINAIGTGAYSATSNSVTLDIPANGTASVTATMTMSAPSVFLPLTDAAKVTASLSIATSSGFASPDKVPFNLPVSINDHAYMMDFAKSRITTMQVRRQASDQSVEPGEQTLSVAGVWPRAQDNYFLGAGQEFLDNRFAFESVYVHSGEYPSVRTRFWKSQGVNPWSEGKLSLHNEYASIATSAANLLIIACGTYLYHTDGASLYWTNNPVGVATPTWTKVTSTNTNNIVSLATDGSRVWFACGSQGVLVTVAGTTTSAAAATPAALNGIGGANASLASAGTTNTTNLPNAATTWYVSEVDAFGNETTAVALTATVAGHPVNLTWNPDTSVSNFKVRRNIGGSDLLIYTGTTPSFTDDGTVAGTVSAHPTANGTGVTAYGATFITYAKGHLVGSTGRDLVEILASGNVSFIFQHENPSFVFTCATECPTAILVGGYAGGTSYVGAIQPDAANAGATLAPPIWASTLTPGEQINAISYDAGAILLGTSLGIRSGTKPDAAGVFDVNPVIETPGAVACVASWSQYEYFGWSNYNPTENWATRSTVSGLGRADLSQFTTPGVPAYATDVMGASIGTTTQVVVMSGTPYFVINNAGAYTLYGPDGKLVSSGWMEPGWIRYGTLETKIVVEVDFQHEPLPSGSSVNYKIVEEDGITVANVATNTTTNSTTLTDPFSVGLLSGDRFMPIITLTSNAGQTLGPVFHSHITKAMVTTKRQDEVLLALVWADRVQGLGESAKTFELDTYGEYFYLKALEQNGNTVNLTMGSNVRVAYIDQVMFEPTGVNDARTWLVGTCTVKLVTLS